MSIIWHSLVQRVLGELNEVWQLASDKLTKAQFDVFRGRGNLHDRWRPL